MSAIPIIVTDRGAAPPDGYVAKTPMFTRDVMIRTMTPVAQVGVRVVRTWLQSFVGFLLLSFASAPIAGSLGVQIAPGDLWDKVVLAAGLALAPTLISLAQNTLELFARVDELFPKARA